MKKTIKIFILLLATSCLPYIAKAQFDLPTIGNIKPTISLSPDPLTPLPNSTVTITANLSGIIGAGGANYTWFLNGARQSSNSGLNKNVFNLRAETIGTIYKVSVNVTTPDETSLSETINFTVSDIDLTWTTNSKSPVFYRAKSLPTQNSIVTISALPFIYRPGTKSQISSGSLIYNWKVGGKLDTLKSGISRQSYVFRTNSFFGADIVRLEVKTQDGAVSLAKDISIPVVRPQIWLYFSDSKTDKPFGIALKNLTTNAANFNFSAQAYFFTTKVNNLKWQWFINNTEVKSSDEKPWLATLNLADNFFGQLSTQIKVTAKNTDDELESSQSITNLEIR